VHVCIAGFFSDFSDVLSRFDIVLKLSSLHKNCLVAFKTNIPDFRSSEMEVYRRFSDFLGLHEKLVEKHLHRGCIIPPPPEKSVIGMLTMVVLLTNTDIIVNGLHGGSLV